VCWNPKILFSEYIKQYIQYLYIKTKLYNLWIHVLFWVFVKPIWSHPWSHSRTKHKNTWKALPDCDEIVDIDLTWSCWQVKLGDREIEVGQVAMSGLLGGIAYFYGQSRIAIPLKSRVHILSRKVFSFFGWIFLVSWIGVVIDTFEICESVDTLTIGHCRPNKKLWELEAFGKIGQLLYTLQFAVVHHIHMAILLMRGTISFWSGEKLLGLFFLFFFFFFFFLGPTVVVS